MQEREWKRRAWSGGAGPVIALGVILAGTAGGCGGDDTSNPVKPGTDGGPDTSVINPPPDEGGTPDGPQPPNGLVGTIAPAANDVSFRSPFDATPDSTGQNIYFTALASDGSGAGVFKVSAAGGVPVKLAGGDPFSSPFGIAISDDDKTLYIADASASNASNADLGTMFSLPTAGGTPTSIAGTEGFVPRGVDVNGANVWFTGTAADGSRGVFKIPAAGGTVTPVVVGAPFTDPSGIAVTTAGDAFVSDSLSADSRRSSVIKVTGGTAALFVGDIAVGFPAGIALSKNDATVLVSGNDVAAGTDVVYLIDTTSKDIKVFSKTIDAFFESAGLHRARKTDVFAWADSQAKDTGTVFVLSK